MYHQVSWQCWSFLWSLWKCQHVNYWLPHERILRCVGQMRFERGRIHLLLSSTYHWHNKMKTQYNMFGQLIYLIFYLIFSTQNWLEIEILELQKEIVERTKLTNIFFIFLYLGKREESKIWIQRLKSYYILISFLIVSYFKHFHGLWYISNMHIINILSKIFGIFQMFTNIANINIDIK